MDNCLLQFLRVVIVIYVSVCKRAYIFRTILSDLLHIVVNMDRSRKRDADEGPKVFEVVSVRLVFLAKHLFETFFSSDVHHIPENHFLSAFTRGDDSEPESGWDAEADDTFDVSSDDFEVHQANE